MSDRFKTLELSQARTDLESLHQTVGRDWGRIEITRSQNPACVLISKAELESIEGALEVFATAPGGRNLHRTVAQIADELNQSSIRRSAPARLVIDSIFRDRPAL